MKVAAIIVTYNRKKLLCECIDAILNQKSNTPMDIIVVDNNSTDGTRDVVASYVKCHNVVYCNTGENLGGGRRISVWDEICCRACVYSYLGYG